MTSARDLSDLDKQIEESKNAVKKLRQESDAFFKEVEKDETKYSELVKKSVALVSDKARANRKSLEDQLMIEECKLNKINDQYDKIKNYLHRFDDKKREIEIEKLSSSRNIIALVKREQECKHNIQTLSAQLNLHDELVKRKSELAASHRKMLNTKLCPVSISPSSNSFLRSFVCSPPLPLKQKTPDTTKKASPTTPEKSRSDSVPFMKRGSSC